MLLTDVASELNHEREKLEGVTEESKDEPAYPPNI